MTLPEPETEIKMIRILVNATDIKAAEKLQYIGEIIDRQRGN